MAQTKSALIIGTSRGLGFALAEEFLKRDWDVTGTVRDLKNDQLQSLAGRFSNGPVQRFTIESLDITNFAQLAELKKRLQGNFFDLLFVNAGVGNANGMSETIGSVSTDDFNHVMVTNTLSPMRVVEALRGNVKLGGTIGVMSSGQGSIADNERGANDVYRASKAALNMLMKSFAARTKDYCLLLIAPGWIKTDLGGDDAKFTIGEAIPQVVDTIIAQSGKMGLQYLDRFGKTVRW